MAGELARAICQVMAEVPHIEKTGWNNHNRYKYASDEDVLNALQPAMAAAGLALIPQKVETQTAEHGTSGRGNTNWRTDLVVTWVLLHTSGESMEVQAPGCGLDQQDKGVYKAMTGALKYALRFLFLVPAGDDPERDERPTPKTGRQEPPRRPAPPQRPQRNQGPPEWLLDQLCSEEGGWDRSKVVEEVRDFTAWVGMASDPWAASEARLRKMPGWLAGQTEALEAWLGWWAEVDAMLTKARVERAGLRRWLQAHGQTVAERRPEDDRRKLLAYLKESNQLDQVHAWLTAQQAGGGACADR